MKKPEPAPRAVAPSSVAVSPSWPLGRALGIGEAERQAGDLDAGAARRATRGLDVDRHHRRARPARRCRRSDSGAPGGGAKARPAAPALGDQAAARRPRPAGVGAGPVDDAAGGRRGGERQAGDGPQHEFLALHHRRSCDPLVGRCERPLRPCNIGLRVRYSQRRAARWLVPLDASVVRRRLRQDRGEPPRSASIAPDRASSSGDRGVGLDRAGARATASRPARRRPAAAQRPEPQQPGARSERRREQDEVAVAADQIVADLGVGCARRRSARGPGGAGRRRCRPGCRRWTRAGRRRSGCRANRAWARASWAASGRGRSGAERRPARDQAARSGRPAAISRARLMPPPSGGCRRPAAAAGRSSDSSAAQRHDQRARGRSAAPRGSSRRARSRPGRPPAVCAALAQHDIDVVQPAEIEADLGGGLAAGGEEAALGG